MRRLRVWSYLVALSLVLTAGLPARADSVEPSLSELAVLRALFATPDRGRGELGATTEGLLYSPMMGGHAAIDWNFEVERRQSAEYWFSAGGRAPWVLYFATDRGTNPLRNWGLPLPKVTRKGKVTTATYTAPVASRLWPSADSPFGLRAQAHVVRLRVNAGKGAGDGLHFVADDVHILDEKLALDPTALLNAFLAEVANPGSPQQRELRQLLTAALPPPPSSAANSENVTGAAAHHQLAGGFRASWLSDQQLLELVYYVRLTRLVEERRKNPHPRAGTVGCDAPPGADCAPRRIPAFFVTVKGDVAETAVIRTLGPGGVLRAQRNEPVRVSSFTRGPSADDEP